MKTTLLGPQRPNIVKKLADFADTTVRNTGGLSGFALKGALKLAKSTNPDIIPTTINRFMPELAEILEPHWQAYQQDSSTTTFGDYLTNHGTTLIAEIERKADEAAHSLNNAALEKTYTSTKGKALSVAKDNLAGLGNILESFMP